MSSTFGGITLRDRTGDLELPMFIAMDQPKHDEQRKIVGVLGVIGPTRINYGRIIPMVDYTARLVSRLLT